MEEVNLLSIKAINPITKPIVKYRICKLRAVPSGEPITIISTISNEIINTAIIRDEDKPCLCFFIKRKKANEEKPPMTTSKTNPGIK